MRINILIIILFISAKVFAQCNIEYSKNGNEYTCTAEFEKIYRNNDLQDGLKVYHVATSQSLGTNTISAKFLLFGSSSLYQKLVIPRNVEFTFLDNSKLFLKASNLKNSSEGGLTSYLGEFILSENQFKLLGSNKISNIMVYDNRTEEYFKIPFSYSSLIIEQIYCLQNPKK